MILPDSCNEITITRSSLEGSSGAIFDVTSLYRYSLWRTWSTGHPRVAFIMLNPSAAGAQHNDPTIRRCISFARAWGFGSLEVVNLFAYRTPDPRALSRVANPVGEDNDRFLTQAVTRSHCLVVAWGTKGALLSRDQVVLDLLTGQNCLYCLGMTKDGHPLHPLYVKGDVPLLPFGK